MGVRRSVAENFVDEAVLLGIDCGEVLVSLGVALNLLLRLTCVLGDDAIEFGL